MRRWLIAFVLILVGGFYGSSLAQVTNIPGPSHYFCPGGPTINTACRPFDQCLDDTAVDPNDWTVWQAVSCVNGAAVWQVISGVTGSGSGAPIDAPYLTRTPQAGLSAEQALSLLASGLMVNTTGTGVVSIYAGTLCNTQFVRSLTAAGVATCASVDVADLAFDPATQVELDAHVNDNSAAHSAAAIGFTPAGTIAATEVQAALEEVALEAKAYADAVAQGLDPKASVLVCTTANITLSGEQTIDGVLTSTSRVLVKAQTLGETNGIYVSAAGAWARATDADISGEVTTGLFTFCEQGTAHGSQGWVLVTPAVITLGVTPLSFTQFSGAGTITASGGLQKVGADISVAPSGITSAMIANSTIVSADISGSAAITKAQISDTSAWGVAEIPDLPASKITSGTLAAARLPTPTASTLGGVLSSTCPAGQVADGIDTAGAVICATDSGGPNTITSTSAPVDGVDACTLSDHWLHTTDNVWYVPLDCTVGAEIWVPVAQASGILFANLPTSPADGMSIWVLDLADDTVVCSGGGDGSRRGNCTWNEDVGSWLRDTPVGLQTVLDYSVFPGFSDIPCTDPLTIQPEYVSLGEEAPRYHICGQAGNLYIWAETGPVATPTPLQLNAPYIPIGGNWSFSYDTGAGDSTPAFCSNPAGTLACTGWIQRVLDIVTNCATAGGVLYNDTGNILKCVTGTEGKVLTFHGTSDPTAETPTVPAASAIPSTPAGGLAADDVQEALNELDTEKGAKATVNTIWLPAGSLDVDGAQCISTPSVAIATDGPTTTVICADNAASIMYSPWIRMPKRWNCGQLSASITTADVASSGHVYSVTFDGQVRNAAAISTTYGTPSAASSVTMTTANIPYKTATQNFTANGTCSSDGNDMLRVRATVASAGAHTDANANTLGLSIFFTTTTNTDL